MPRLYGGDVTTRSTPSSASRDIASMQSSRRRSNLVIVRIWRDYMLRTSRKWPTRSVSGEHRLPACPFRQPAEKLFERSMTEVFSTLRKSSASGRRQQAGSLCSPDIDTRTFGVVRLLSDNAG